MYKIGKEVRGVKIAQMLKDSQSTAYYKLVKIEKETQERKTSLFFLRR